MDESRRFGDNGESRKALSGLLISEGMASGDKREGEKTSVTWSEAASSNLALRPEPTGDSFRNQCSFITDLVLAVYIER